MPKRARKSGSHGRRAGDTFWVFDAVATHEARQAHADGEIVKALNANAHLLAEDPGSTSC